MMQPWDTREMKDSRRRELLVAWLLVSAAVAAWPGAAADSKPDLTCSLQAWGARNRDVADGGSVVGTPEANGQRGLEYALTVRNGGGAAAGFKVRYDYVLTLGAKELKESKPPAAFPAFDAGRTYTTPRMKVTTSGPASVLITATVDSEGAVAESDEGNNSCKISVELK